MRPSTIIKYITLATVVILVCCVVPVTAYSPNIISVNPSNRATGVPVNTDIVITMGGNGFDFGYSLKPAGGASIGLLPYKVHVDNIYDPYGNLIGTQNVVSCYPINANSQRISLQPGTLYGVYVTYTFNPSEVYGISSFTTGGSAGNSPGALTASPAAVSWGNGRIDLSAGGSNGDAWHQWWQNSWGTWEDLNGQLLPGTGPAVSSWGSGRLDVFVVGANDHHLWHKAWTGSSWTAWEDLGGYLTATPAAVSWSNGRIDIFARGGEGHTWHTYWQNGWGTWEDIGGQLLPGTGPAVSSWGSGRLDVFVVGSGDHNLWHKAWTGSSWTNFESLGGYLTATPAAVSWGPNRIDIFARGGEGHTWHQWWQNGWGSWEDIGGQLLPGTGPAVSSWGSGRLDVFVVGSGDQALWHKWWDGSSWNGYAPLGS